MLDRKTTAGACFGQPRELLFRCAPGDDQILQPVRVSRLDQQSGFDHGDGIRLGALDGGKFTVLSREDQRMHDGIQARQALGIGKHDAAQLGAVHTAIGLENAAAKFADNIIIRWCAGLETAHENGHDLGRIASVASFFVSRVDAAVDKLLPVGDSLRGSIANAQVAAAYQLYLRWMASDRVVALLAQGAQVQRPLWASTSPKNPSYNDLLYVDSIVADETVNTMPDATLDAALDHGNFAESLLATPASIAQTAAILDRLPRDISLDQVTDQLERDGVDSFASSYEELLTIISSKLTGQ